MSGMNYESEFSLVAFSARQKRAFANCDKLETSRKSAATIMSMRKTDLRPYRRGSRIVQVLDYRGNDLGLADFKLDRFFMTFL